MYKIECEKVLKNHKHLKSPISIHNKFFWYIACNLIMPTSAYLIFGFSGAFAYFRITAVSIFAVEAINYLEHYGLVRK